MPCTMYIWFRCLKYNPVIYFIYEFKYDVFSVSNVNKLLPEQSYLAKKQGGENTISNSGDQAFPFASNQSFWQVKLLRYFKSLYFLLPPKPPQQSDLNQTVRNNDFLITAMNSIIV